MRLHLAVIGACAGVLVLAAQPAQASSMDAGARAASNASNSAVQSAVQSARDDAWRRAMAQQRSDVELRRVQKHHRSR